VGQKERSAILTRFLAHAHASLKDGCFHDGSERNGCSKRKRRELDVMDKELDATTEAVIAVDQAHLTQVADAAGWERRGLLQTLARTDGVTTESWWRGRRRR
jgi:hypothetical protein